MFLSSGNKFEGSSLDVIAQKISHELFMGYIEHKYPTSAKAVIQV